MIRENKDGRPIFYDSIWNKIINIGKKLIKLGYKETEKKPNLFYKPIKTEKNSKDNKTVQVKGVVFADLRGTGFVPIWDDPSPLFYSLDLPISIFLPEFILLVQSGCSPRVSFEEECESGGWIFGLDELPSGYCKRCGENILSEVNWEILKENFFELYHQGIIQNIEVNYCKTCRELEYAMREYRNQHFSDFKICELCGTKESQIKHHITYNPEKILHVCRSCHGKLHNKAFPHPLWKEKRNKIN